MKQTAVEWLVEQLARKNNEFQALTFYYDHKEEIEQALQMEKEQHSKTFEAGNKRGWSGYPNTDNWTQPTFEHYYNETFKTKNHD